MKNVFTKEVAVKVGEAGLKIGKTIIVEGTKAVILKGTINTLEAKFEGKEVTLDKVLGNDKKEKKEKKKFFKRKKKELIETSDEIIETVETIVTETVEVIKPEEA